jgi:class 3 adenylate cyclase/streptogramin lyase
MRRASKPSRVLATVLFTDIVGSTELAASLGDRRWRDLVSRHHGVVRARLKQYRGQEVDTAGDGFFAIFDTPVSAIECARSIADALRPLGIEIRAGIHTGEVERSGKGASGIAVHVGARVMATAGPGEIVVTSTVRDLAAGSEITFTDRGLATLRGIDGEWHLYGVEVPPTDLVAPESEVVGEGERRRPWALLAAGAVGLAAVGVVAAGLLLPSVLAGPIVPSPGSVARVPAGGSSFDAEVRVGRQPTGLAIGGGAVWVANFIDGTLSRVDPETESVTANPAVTGNPTGIAHGAGSVWVTTHFGRPEGAAGVVVRFDDRGTIVDTIPVGNGAEGVVAVDGTVYVADRIHEEVLRIDPGTAGIDGDPIPVGRAPGAIAVGAGSLWVTSTLDSTLWRMDLADQTSQRISLPGRPTAVAVGEDAAWVTSEEGDSLTRVDLADHSLRTIRDLDRARGVAVGPVGLWVAVAGRSSLTRIDPTSGTVAVELAVAGAPNAVAVDESGAVWVSVGTP